MASANDKPDKPEVLPDPAAGSPQPDEAARPRRARALWRRVLAAALVAACLAVALAAGAFRWYLGSDALRRGIEQRGSQGLGVPLTIGRIRAEGFSALTLHDLAAEFADPEARVACVRAERLSIRSGLPLLFWHGPEEADNHFVRTLREIESRSGRDVEFDRNRYLVQDDTSILRTFSGEELILTGRKPISPGTVSVRARFEGPHEIQVREFHMHSTWLRNSTSYVGLAIILLFWTRAGWVGLSTWFRAGHLSQRRRP